MTQTRELQLSSILPDGTTVEQAIMKNPLAVQELTESGQLKLAHGAMLFLRDEVAEWLSCWPMGGVDPQNFY